MVNPTTPGAREIAMRDMFVQGVCLQDIGDKFNVSRERVRQLLKRWFSLSAKDGGFRRSMAMRREAKAAAIEARVKARWGVEVEVWRQCRRNGVLRLYQQQRKNAHARGIDFRLTFGQWLAVWEASGKLELRGRGKGRYCMSRLNDCGAYEIGNVHIQLSDENSRDATKKWVGAKPKKHRGVFHLYPGTSKPFMAKAGSRVIGYFATEDEARAERDRFMLDHGMRENRLGAGRGWTFDKRCKTRPYRVQVTGTKPSYHATEEEAVAEYHRRVGEVVAARRGV